MGTRAVHPAIYSGVEVAVVGIVDSTVVVVSYSLTMSFGVQ